MKRKDALAELIAKVEAGEWPGTNILHKIDDSYGFDAWRAYNGSLDAAKALHEAVLPGWVVDQMGQRAGGWLVLFGRQDGKTPRRPPQAMIRDNPARAWLLAILRALHSMEPDT